MVRVSSRSVLEETLRESVLRERPEVFPALCVVIDKLDKIGPEKVLEQLTASDGPVGLDPAPAQRVIEMLGARDLEDAASFAPPDSPALAELRRLFELLDAYGIADRAIFDASVVRGLAYSPGVVFEAFDTRGALRAICGGGRYDRLLESLGGPGAAGRGFRLW